MTVTINGTTGITAPAINGPLDAADLTGSLPAIDGSALTSLSAGNLTGALPAISGAALTGLPAPTSAQVGSATAGLALGAVGTYAWLIRTTTSTTVSAGATYAGSGLQFAGGRIIANYSTQLYSGGVFGSTVAGTWMAVGHCGNNSAMQPSTVFLRIA